MPKTCYYCGNVEHDDTQGVMSVYPKHEGKWFCSSNCLYEHTQGGLRMNKTNKKSFRNRAKSLD
tara:strand:+ start:407 stop:598 length:192 start_codon:yes stop_codon:yes gene_type:complete